MSKLPIKKIPKNSLLYKRSHHKLLKSSFKKYKLHWFALSPGYGSDDTYGPIITTWKIEKNMKFLNISTMKNRRIIAKELDINIYKLDPNEQYSGGQGNIKIHEILMPIISKYKLNGTYINDEEADEDCEGPTEIVLTRESIKNISKC